MINAEVIDMNDKCFNQFVVKLVLGSLLFLISVFRMVNVMTAAKRYSNALGIHSAGDRLYSVLLLMIKESETLNTHFH